MEILLNDEKTFKALIGMAIFTIIRKSENEYYIQNIEDYKNKLTKNAELKLVNRQDSILNTWKKQFKELFNIEIKNLKD